MKPLAEDDNKLKKYLSMKNLGPQLVSGSKDKLTVPPVTEVRESLELDKAATPKQDPDNIFFEDFSEEVSRKARDSNTMSTTSFKKVSGRKRRKGPFRTRRAHPRTRAFFRSRTRSFLRRTIAPPSRTLETRAKGPFRRSGSRSREEPN